MKEAMIRKMNLNPYLSCLLVRDVLKKYKIIEYEIKKGYLVFEKYYFTYFWLESDSGDRIDPNETKGVEYTYQEDAPHDYECIDDASIVASSLECWESGRYPKDILSKKNEILKKHPNKTLCKSV